MTACLDLKIVTNQQTRGSTRRSTKRRSRRQGGDSVGKYFGDAWSLAKRTANGLNEIRKLINVEEKFIDATGAPTFDRNGTVTYISGMAQGDNISEREGNSIKVQNLQLKYSLIYNTLSTGPTITRVLIVRDLQNQGVIPTCADVLETLGTSTAPYAPYDYTNSMLNNKRFSIVYDNLVNLDTYHPSYVDTFTTNHDCHVFFRGTTGAVASAGNGSYFFLQVSSDTGANLPTCLFTSRLVFTDN